MGTTSAGLLLYRVDGGVLQVWIGHMGGPFWQRKDAAAWSIPKGEYEDGEEPLAVALREFEEEMGVPAPAAEYAALGEFDQSRKRVTLFTAEAEFEPGRIWSNTFTTEWPPHSGTTVAFPEIDRADWFSIADAREKLVVGQRAALDLLVERLRSQGRAFSIQ